MNIATVVLTTPRPTPTLRRTLHSLSEAGFGEVDIHNDRAKSGHFRAYMDCLAGIIRRRGDADAYFVVEDDVVFCRGLREYLDGALWPGDYRQLAFCSPYCPAAYRKLKPGWDNGQSWRGLYLAGSQAWVFTPHAARAMLHALDHLRNGKEQRGDLLIGRWIAESDRRIWYHTPSLAQHIGETDSVIPGNAQQSTLRHAADFVGEAFDMQ